MKRQKLCKLFVFFTMAYMLFFNKTMADTHSAVMRQVESNNIGAIYGRVWQNNIPSIDVIVRVYDENFKTIYGEARTIKGKGQGSGSYQITNLPCNQNLYIISYNPKIQNFIGFTKVKLNKGDFKRANISIDIVVPDPKLPIWERLPAILDIGGYTSRVSEFSSVPESPGSTSPADDRFDNGEGNDSPHTAVEVREGNYNNLELIDSDWYKIRVQKGRRLRTNISDKGCYVAFYSTTEASSRLDPVLPTHSRYEQQIDYNGWCYIYVYTYRNPWSGSYNMKIDVN